MYYLLKTDKRETLEDFPDVQAAFREVIQRVKAGHAVELWQDGRRVLSGYGIGCKVWVSVEGLKPVSM